MAEQLADRDLALVRDGKAGVAGTFGLPAPGIVAVMGSSMRSSPRCSSSMIDAAVYVLVVLAPRKCHVGCAPATVLAKYSRVGVIMIAVRPPGAPA